MDIVGCIPARIYVTLPTSAPEAAHAFLHALAEELDTLDFTDADVALFAGADGRIRPDFTQPFSVVAGLHGVLPLPTEGAQAAGYTVRLQVVQAPGVYSADATELLGESGLLGEHHYVLPEAANAVEACTLAEQRLRQEWTAIPSLETTILVDVLSVVRRTRHDISVMPTTTLPTPARAD